jgi:DNA-binding transcriptional LysR family regulator
MRMNCEIADIKAFLTVLDAGSFQNAALQLNMSQPTVSRRVKALEATLGTTLLQRTTRHIALTSAGRSLESSLRRIICEFESCSFSLNGSGAQRAKRITIASIATAASSFLPRVLKRFSVPHSDVQCRIVDLSAEEGLERVARSEADFGINFLRPSTSDLKFTPLMDDDFVVACRSDHAFASKRSIRWADLADQPLIISQRSGNRALVDQALFELPLRLNWSYEDVHLATSFGLVEAGIGMAIIPRMAGPASINSTVAIVRICDPIVRRTVGLVERRGGSLSRPVVALRTLLIEEIALLNTSPAQRLR